MVYWLTESFRDSSASNLSNFSSMIKNLQWWQNDKFEIVAELISEEDADEFKSTVFELNRRKYQDNLNKYYSNFVQSIVKKFKYIPNA